MGADVQTVCRTSSPVAPHQPDVTLYSPSACIPALGQEPSDLHMPQVLCLAGDMVCEESACMDKLPPSSSRNTCVKIDSPGAPRGSVWEPRVAARNMRGIKVTHHVRITQAEYTMPRVEHALGVRYPRAFLVGTQLCDGGAKGEWWVGERIDGVSVSRSHTVSASAGERCVIYHVIHSAVTRY